MKIGLLGCKGTTLDLLHTIQQRGSFLVDQLITLPADVAARNRVAFYRGEELQAAGREMGIPVHVVRSYPLRDPADLAFFQEAGLDLLLVIGWERIIPDTVLGLLGKFACGMHGSAYGLPRGRGRSPLNWSILTGQNRFITYLFRYDPGIDSGNIIGFKVFEINEFDDIASLHMKNRTAMYQLLETYVPLIQQDQVTFIPQPPEQPSFYPKRTPQDSGVDWSMSTQAIHRLIRAVAPPYPPAYCFLGQRQLYLLEAAPYDVSLFYGDVEPGTVVDVSSSLGVFVVKTVDGSLLVRKFQGVSIQDLRVGDILGGIDQNHVLAQVEERYPAELSDDQKEIRRSKRDFPVDPSPVLAAPISAARVASRI